MGFDHWFKKVFQAFLFLAFASMDGIILCVPLWIICNFYYAASAMQ